MIQMPIKLTLNPYEMRKNHWRNQRERLLTGLDKIDLMPVNKQEAARKKLHQSLDRQSTIMEWVFKRLGVKPAKWT